MRVDGKNANASSQRSTIAEVQTIPAGSGVTQAGLPKNKVSPYDQAQSRPPSVTLSIPTNDEASSNNHLQQALLVFDFVLLMSIVPWIMAIEIQQKLLVVQR
jgi:hypothetical protein